MVTFDFESVRNVRTVSELMVSCGAVGRRTGSHGGSGNRDGVLLPTSENKQRAVSAWFAPPRAAAGALLLEVYLPLENDQHTLRAFCF